MIKTDFDRPPRHPWLDALVSNPVQEVRNLLEGHADIHPFGPSEPADAAASLLFRLPPDDLAVQAFDSGCLGVMNALRSEILSADGDQADLCFIVLDRLLTVCRCLLLPKTILDLHRRYAFWFGVLETCIVDRNLDLRREYWRVLALTQDVMAKQVSPRRLMSLWLKVCAESGDSGLYDVSYLDVGLMGLRSLPLGAEHSSNEEAECHGLARWAVRQQPSKTKFLARWHETESAYPRSASYWLPLINDVVVSVESGGGRPDSRSESKFSFSFVQWWLDDVEAPSGSGKKFSARQLDPPSRENREELIAKLGAPLSSFKLQLNGLMKQHRTYADRSGDTYHIVHSACNIGMRLLRGGQGESVERGVVAAHLAREALEYEPSNFYAWGLWSDGLEAQGAFSDAEDLNWEAIRLFPEDPQRRSKLAKLLTEKLGRPEEAERLLRDAYLLFQSDRTLGAQLARTLSYDLDRPDEAIVLLRKSIQDHPGNFPTYTQLAQLLSERGDQKEAIAVFEELARRETNNGFAADILPRLRAGERLRRARRKRAAVIAPAASLSGAIGLDVRAARARRSLFQVESAAEPDAALKSFVSQNSDLAYIRYVAQRIEIARAGNESAFAFEFDRALRSGSPEALQQLAQKTGGIHRASAAAGLQIVEGRIPDLIIESQYNAGSDALRHRLASLESRIAPSLAEAKDKRPFLRLLSDFAASELSVALAA